MLHSSNLKWGQEQVRLNDGVRRDKRLGRKERLQGRRRVSPESLWLVVPFCSSETSICTNKIGLNNSSCEWSRCLCAAQWEVLPLEKLCSALDYWVFRTEEENAIWTPGNMALRFIFGFIEHFTINSKGSDVDEKDWELLLVIQHNWGVHDQRNSPYKNKLKAHRQKKKIWAHLQSCWVEDCSSHKFESLSPTYFSN